MEASNAALYLNMVVLQLIFYMFTQVHIMEDLIEAIQKAIETMENSMNTVDILEHHGKIH